MERLIALALILAPIAAARAEAPPPCPTAIGIVDRSVGSTLIYLPADPARPEICRIVLRGGAVAEFIYGTWRTDWPGAEQALPAIRAVYAGGPGTTARFDTIAAPGYAWHETIRNDGFEDLNIAGARRRTMKVTHEREGFDGNTYHSIITQWKDVATNMTVYQNYIHIAGRPEPGVAWEALTVYGGR